MMRKVKGKIWKYVILFAKMVGYRNVLKIYHMIRHAIFVLYNEY